MLAICVNCLKVICKLSVLLYLQVWNLLVHLPSQNGCEMFCYHITAIFDESGGKLIDIGEAMAWKTISTKIIIAASHVQSCSLLQLSVLTPLSYVFLFNYFSFSYPLHVGFSVSQSGCRMLFLFISQPALMSGVAKHFQQIFQSVPMV